MVQSYEEAEEKLDIMTGCFYLYFVTGKVMVKVSSYKNSWRAFKHNGNKVISLGELVPFNVSFRKFFLVYCPSLLPCDMASIWEENADCGSERMHLVSNTVSARCAIK